MMPNRKCRCPAWHRHCWHLTQPFATTSGFQWPPMWACPCGLVRDVQGMEDWGLE